MGRLRILIDPIRILFFPKLMFSFFFVSHLRFNRPDTFLSPLAISSPFHFRSSPLSSSKNLRFRWNSPNFINCLHNYYIKQISQCPASDD
ncbi:hypothetical protein L1987_62256 [Smallanthus sonchifolius]|uniref:Uncharacterized protein n=1 Tax=Smallanthus sonchifolius TaxID=185202 RepID=A0ACB9CA54_9ASTR|nr:hypothetical protein L1987_62256 [Smallanthus sonchifolius]